MPEYLSTEALTADLADLIAQADVKVRRAEREVVEAAVEGARWSMKLEEISFSNWIKPERLLLPLLVRCLHCCHATNQTS